MKRIFIGLVLTSLSLFGCSKEEDPVIPNGLFESFVYPQEDIKIVEVAYTSRPNYKNLQYTSEKSKEAERGLSILTPKMDIYLPPNTIPSIRQPLLVMVHGGGYSGGDKQAWQNEAYTYARAGFICASINYRLTQNGGNQSPEFRTYAIQCAVENAQNAIRFLKFNADKYNIDTSRVAIFGGSAGGGVSLINAIEYDAPVCINDFPGVSSKTQGSISTGACLVNDEFAKNPDALHFDPFDTPVLMFFAKEYDSSGNGYTWTANAVPTRDLINASGNICTLIAQPNMTHTVSLDLGGLYWNELKPFIWQQLKLDQLVP